MKLGLGLKDLLGGLLVLAVHGLALWGLLGYRPSVPKVPSAPLFVDLVAPSPPTPMPRAPAAANAGRQLALRQAVTAPAPAATPSLEAGEAPAVARAPSPPSPAVAPSPTPATAVGAAGPVAELSVSCPERVPPDYPLAARRRNETGTALLHVELDEAGRISAASVAESSGFARLDEAALAAVRRWRCNPWRRDGQPVRTTARQAFKFILQGS